MEIHPADLPDDLDELEQLFEACRLADGHAPLGEHKYLDLVRGGGASTLGLIGRANDDGEPIAYAHLSRNERVGVWGLEVAVHPLQRRDEVIEELIVAALRSTAELGGGRVHLWTYHPKIGALLRRLGFRQARELRQLARRLPVEEDPEFPPDVTVAAFRVGEDEEAWLEVNNVAFEGHPENGSWDLETLEEREGLEWFDPEGFRMAWQDGRLVGFCWTKLHPDRVGEIYVIAVHPQHQRRSLGRALVLEGLRYVSEVRKAETAMLYVDAENEPALALYEELGFHLDHVDQCFVVEVGS